MVESSTGPSQFATYPSLRDRVVLISGGATGIGEKLVEAFAAQQARVVFLDIQDEAAEALAARVGGFYHHCDLTDMAALDACMKAVLERFQGVDVLINNAGNDTRHAVEDVTPELWDRVMAVNLKHQFFLTQAVLPGMRQRRRGSIINMSSISWLIPITGVPVYAAAKAAIVGLTRTLAHEVGPDNIRVNAILPGTIATERQKKLWYTEEFLRQIFEAQALKRTLLPEEVARLALFLAADDSSAITNQTHIIDGGWI